MTGGDALSVPQDWHSWNQNQCGGPCTAGEAHPRHSLPSTHHCLLAVLEVVWSLGKSLG